MTLIGSSSSLHKFVIRTLLAGSMLLLLLGWQVSQSAAQTLSPGCTLVNSKDNEFVNISGLSGFSFNAGERIVVSAGAPTDLGSPTTMFLTVNSDLQTTAFPGTLSFIFPADGIYNNVVWRVNDGRVTWSVSCGIPTAEPAPQIPELICPIFTDDRINNCDAAAPFVAYAISGGLDIYAIDDDSNGTLALQVSSDAIAAVPECPAENTLITEDTATGIQVYRLSSCEIQINSPTADGQKTYVLIVDNLNATGYLSREE